MCTWPAASRSLKTGTDSILQQNRRHKKRCSFGVRTVELERSKSGYGFTISGQYPCILSCIVSQSPAERVGLRPGDYLIAVNNKNVSKSLHDDVVRLIGNSTGVLKLQIADNYYTDSSGDEQVTIIRPKQKYPNRSKHALSQIRAEKVVEDLQAGLLFKTERSTKQHDYKNITDAQLLMHQTRNGNKSNGKENCYIEDEVNSIMYTSLHQIQTNREKCDEEAFYRAVVGYLGTIEMPKDLQIPRLQAIRNCIRRLRVEKKVHILVLLSVYHEKVTLINLRGTKVAEYPSEKITYSGIYANDKKFFGLVTSNERRTRSSCHVFIVESKSKLHSTHLQGARTFNKWNLNSGCEFPETAEPILCAISSLYRSRSSNGGSFGLIDVTLTNRSNTSSNSSNSDSGIGFRDDFHHQKDSVFVVHDNSHSKRTNMQSPATVSLNQSENRLTVRAMPNPVGLLSNSTSSGRNSCNFERSSFHKYAPSKNNNENSKNSFRPSMIRPMIAITPKPVAPNIAEYKLSPKVYGVKYPNQLTGKDILAGTAAAADDCYDLLSEVGMDDCKLKDGSQEVNPSEGRYETSESDADEFKIL
uniref:PDZ domain-containing protein n=1 Tax=Strigamia maritima TaxID=126957 RepID=T1JKQ8_STRMM